MNGEAVYAATMHWEPGRFAILEDNTATPTLDMEATETYERLQESINTITRVPRGAFAINVGRENGTNQ